MSVEASNKADFSDAQMMASALEVRATHAEERIDSTEAYRYWRINVPQSTTCGEIILYDEEGKEAQGKCALLFQTAFDGNPLTNLSTLRNTAPTVDFGRPVRLSHIAVLPRSDGNGIYPGDEYELFYFDRQGWKSPGRQTATDFHLDYEGAP